MNRTALFALLALMLGCAHKAAPPNPDRFRPGLTEIVVVNQNRVDLVFDEPMAAKNLSVAEYVMTGPDGDSLPVLALSLSPDNATVSLLTPRQAKVKYRLSGLARDRAGNELRFLKSFIGSARPDTVAPAVLNVEPGPNRTGMRRGVNVTFTFSKPVDTTSLRGLLMIPAAMKERFSKEWDASLAVLRLRQKDSLGPDTAVTVILPAQVRDFAGNHLVQAGFTTFTSDSLPLPRLVQGEVKAAGSVRNCYLVLRQPDPVLAAVVRPDGRFTMRAGPGEYSLVAAADTNYDGRIDLSGSLEPALLPDTVRIELQPAGGAALLESLFLP